MKEQAKEIFLETISKNKPSHLIDKSITIEEHTLKIEDKHFSLHNRPVYVIATGKASKEMGKTLRQKFDVDDNKVIIIDKYPDELNRDKNAPCIIYASHPYPDEKSVAAADALIHFIKKIPAEAVVFFALSGGTSALVSKPAQGISIEEMGEVNELLLSSGASIDQINCVRKHLSKVKGGKLLNYFHPDITLIDLVISDVPGDNLEHIGSGPTVPDSTTFKDSYDILMKLNLWKKVPESVRNHIDRGKAGERSETLKTGDDPIAKHSSFIIGSAKIFAKSMSKVAAQMGYEPCVAETPYNGPVNDVIANIIEKLNKCSGSSDAFIFYGESTVNIAGDGKGGRNQAMALQAAVKIEDMKNITWLSADTDGIDGPTDAAGAIVDNNTITRAKEKGIAVDKIIENNDSYQFHKKMNTHLKTGPTGNNLMDIVLVLTH